MNGVTPVYGQPATDLEPGLDESAPVPQSRLGRSITTDKQEPSATPPARETSMCSHPSTILPRPATDIEVKLESGDLAPSAARRFIAQALAALGYLQLIEDAQLMVSELVTNTVANVPGKPLWVDIRRAGRYLVLEVWDCSTEPPVAQDPDFMDEGGRGLHVVDALSTKWSYDILCCGKVTWVLLG